MTGCAETTRIWFLDDPEDPPIDRHTYDDLASFATHDVDTDEAYEWIEEDVASRLKGHTVLSKIRIGLLPIPYELDVVQSMDDIHTWQV